MGKLKKELFPAVCWVSGVSPASLCPSVHLPPLLKPGAGGPLLRQLPLHPWRGWEAEGQAEGEWQGCRFSQGRAMQELGLKLAGQVLLVARVSLNPDQIPDGVGG